MATAKLFKSGNSQAVRLPNEFRIEGEEVEISRDGDAVVLRPVRKGMAHLIDLIMELPEDMFDGIQDRRPPQTREGL